MPSVSISRTAIRSAAKTGLEKAVARWLARRAEDYSGNVAGVLRDLFYGGCASGIVGELVYTHDCVRFYEKHKADIWELASDSADSQGMDNVPAFIASLNGADMADNPDGFANLLAWFGFEEAARTLANRVDYEG